MEHALSSPAPPMTTLSCLELPCHPILILQSCPFLSSRINMAAVGESLQYLQQIEMAKTISRLPDELLLQIFSHLDLKTATAPSIERFDDEPSITLTCSTDTPIKNLSQVSRRWRSILLPVLFAYSRLHLPSCKRWLVYSTKLQRHIFFHVKGRPKRSAHEDDVIQDVENFVHGLPCNATLRPGLAVCYIEDADHYLKDSPEECKIWAPSPRGTVDEYLAFLRKNGMERHVRSLVIQSDFPYPDDASTLELNCANLEVQHLWRAIFSTVDPSRVVIAAPPSIMASLTESRMGTRDAWMFEMPMHYLEIDKPESETVRATLKDPSPPPSPPYHVNLFNHGPWTRLAYNEGSSVPCYAVYEYFNHSAPRILQHILLWLAKDAPHNPRATKLNSLKYVSIFPFGRHVWQTLEPINRMPSLNSLVLKLAPSPDSDVLDDGRMGRSDRNDCWQEHTRSCKQVVKILTDREYIGRAFSLIVEDYQTKTLVEDLDKIFRTLNARGQRWAKTTDTNCIWVRQ